MSQATAGRQSSVAVLVASAGLFLVALDFSINVSLPLMRDALGATLVTAQGIIIFYHASRSGLAPIAGAVGDAFGLKRVFLTGVVLYTGAVGVIAFQDALMPVLALRVVQGLGAGILFTTGPAIVSRTVGPARKGVALGVTLAAVSAGQLAATLGGGWLAQDLGWEWVFGARLPVGAAVLLLGAIALVDRRAPRVSTTARSFSWANAALLYSGLFLAVMAISFARIDGLVSPRVLGSAAGAALAIPLFMYADRRSANPVIPRGLWVSSGFFAGALSNLLIYVGSFITWFLFPFYVSDILGRGALALGGMLAVTAATTTAGSIAGGWLSDRFGDRPVTAAGACLTAAGLFWIAALGGAAALPAIAAMVALAGLGFGIHQAAVYSLTLRHTRGEHSGSGSAVLAVAQTLGVPLSITVGTAVFTWRQEQFELAGMMSKEAFMGGFAWAYSTAAVMCLAAGAVALVRRKRSAT